MLFRMILSAFREIHGTLGIHPELRSVPKQSCESQGHLRAYRRRSRSNSFTV